MNNIYKVYKNEVNILIDKIVDIIRKKSWKRNGRRYQANCK